MLINEPRDAIVFMTDLPKRKKSRVEQLLEQLRRDILKGTFKPRERLLEERIARKYGMSRSPIREAFRILGLDQRPRAIHGGHGRKDLRRLGKSARRPGADQRNSDQ